MNVSGKRQLYLSGKVKGIIEVKWSVKFLAYRDKKIRQRRLTLPNVNYPSFKCCVSVLAYYSEHFYSVTRVGHLYRDSWKEATGFHSIKLLRAWRGFEFWQVIDLSTISKEARLLHRVIGVFQLLLFFCCQFVPI